MSEWVEWWCTKVLCAANAEDMAAMSLRVGAVQLLDAALHYIVKNLCVVVSTFSPPWELERSA